MESHRSKRAIKVPKKYLEDEGEQSGSLLALPVQVQSSLFPICITLSSCHSPTRAEGNQAERETPEAQETFDVYRLLKRKEVTKDLVDQEV